MSPAGPAPMMRTSTSLSLDTSIIFEKGNTGSRLWREAASDTGGRGRHVPRIGIGGPAQGVYIYPPIQTSARDVIKPRNLSMVGVI